MSTVNKAPKLLFQGEMMTCVMCGKQQKSDPGVMTQWRGIEWGEKVFYVCPDEMPPDSASAGAFSKAYRKVLEYIIAREKKA